MKEREEGRYIAVLLSTVLEKGGDGTLVAVGAGCLASYTPERHTRQRHFLYTISPTLPSSLALSLSSSLLVISLMSFFSFRLGHTRRENNALQSRIARSLIRLPVAANSFGSLS